MGKGRLEAFSDGIFAIILTIMVLELRVPAGDDLAALFPLLPVFMSYVLSYLYLAIYWNNHHHLLQAVQSVNGRVLWANQLLLFWLSLVPFVTHWMGEREFRPWPVACYGVVLLCAAPCALLPFGWMDAIHRDLYNHTGLRTRDDDQTLVVMQLNADAPKPR